MYLPLSRALEILQLLARSRDGASLSAIGEEVQLAKSAVHRLLASLVVEGYVRQDPSSEHYHLTLRLPALGFRFLSTNGMPDVVQPVLNRLAQQTGELAQLGLVDNDSLLWVAWAQGSQAPLRYVPVFGREVVLHTTGSGATWLASLEDREVLRILRKHGLKHSNTPGYGRNAVRSEAEFMAKIAKVRRDGYSLNQEEGEPGINAIAVAFRSGADPASPVVGTLSVAGPSIRSTKQKLIEMLPALRSRARELSEVWPMHLQIKAADAPRAGAGNSAGHRHTAGPRRRAGTTEASRESSNAR